MIINKEEAKIDKFVFNHEKAYRIRYKDSFWGVNVFRADGHISFVKSGILPETVDQFEACYDGQKTRIYLYTTTEKQGARREYIGETEEHLTAMLWVREVNEFYFTKIHPKYTKERERHSVPIDWMPIVKTSALRPITQILLNL